MSELLFVNACVRGARSRTLALARHFLTEYEKSHPGDRVTELNLMEERLEPQYPEVLAERDTLWNAGRLEEPCLPPPGSSPERTASSSPLHSGTSPIPPS